MQRSFPPGLTLWGFKRRCRSGRKVLTLSGGYKHSISGNKVFCPNGTPLHKGVKIGQRRTPCRSAEGKDTSLEEALRQMAQ